MGPAVNTEINIPCGVLQISNKLPRWEVPLEISPPKGGNSNPLYAVEFQDEPVFSFRIIRKATGTILFDTSLGGLTFSDQFLQITTKLPSTNLFGIGENEQKSYRHNFDKRRVWPLYTRDQPPEVNDQMHAWKLAILRLKTKLF
jgi:hypothetical protein